MNLLKSSTPLDVNRIPVIWRGSCVEFLDNYYNFRNDFCDEINILFISDLEDLTFFSLYGTAKIHAM